MSNFDLVIHGGTLVFADEAVPGDIGVSDGKIAPISAPGMLGNGARTIDATDLHVFSRDRRPARSPPDLPASL